MPFKIRKINKGTSPIAILVTIAILLIGLMVGKSIATSPQMSLILTAGIVIGLLTIVKTDIALIILIFSMLLSPELKVAGVPGREVVVRVDDILLIVVFVTWLAKMALNKQLGLLKHTPLNLPIACYILVCVLSTARGVATGRVHLLRSSFYILKYIEYFILYFMVTNNIRSKKQIKIFIVVFLITCALVCGYASTQIGTLSRTTAPFEGPHGEPNTLGGYLVLLFAVSLGLFLYSPQAVWRFCSGALACFIILPFLFSLSRGSYLGFTAMYLTLIILTKRKMVFLIVILLLAIPILPITLPTRVTERITKTFIPGRVYEPLGERIALDDSAAARVETWKGVLEEWKDRPILGYGVTGAGLVDSQYPRVLGETGIIGLWVFGWLMLTIFRRGLQTFKTVKDDWTRGLTLGFLAGFVGLLVHSFAANTFIIVRIMEPFWFLAAIVVVLPEIITSPQTRREI